MIGIAAAARVAAMLHLEACPNWVKGACTCPTDEAGNPVPAHPTYQFPAQSPDAKDQRSPAQWAAACAREALLLVQAARAAQPSTALPDLVGVAI